MSLKGTKELEEAKAEIERISALNSDQQDMITSMRAEIERLNSENENLNSENEKLDAENATLVKSLETKCLELLKAKSAQKVVVSAQSMTRPVMPVASSVSAIVSAPVKRASKMSFVEANPDLKKEFRWESFWRFIDRWLIPISAVSIILYVVLRFFV